MPMAGIFSCCGYDNTADNDDTLNDIANSPKNSGFRFSSDCHSSFTDGATSPKCQTSMMNGSPRPGLTAGPPPFAASSNYAGAETAYYNGSSARCSGGGVVGSDGRMYSNGGGGGGSLREEEDNDASSSVMTLSPQQKEREKMRLQALVKSFAKSAVGGVSCWLLHVDSSVQEGAKYALDKSLMTFTVSQDRGTVTSFDMSNLQEVHSYEDLMLSANTEFITREPGVAGLSLDQRSRLVVLDYVDSQVNSCLKRLLLLEHCPDRSSEDAKDRFVTCMKILRLYALTAIGAAK